MASRPLSPRAAAAAAHERRLKQKPVPDDLAACLNELQRLALRRLEAFGWRVRFVRRPAGEPPTVVVGDPTGRDRAVLTEQGQLDRHIKLKVR